MRDIRFEEKRSTNIQNILYDIQFWSPYITTFWYRTEMFCTPDGAKDPTFQMRYGTEIEIDRDILQTILGTFFLGHPVYMRN